LLKSSTMRSLYIQAACSDAGKIIFSTSEFPLVEILPAALGGQLFSTIYTRDQAPSWTNLNV
jgi:hypothetical protein